MKEIMQQLSFSQFKSRSRNYLGHIISHNTISYNINLNPIKCGGDNKLNQEREQWTDGANYFTLSPGIIIGYDCNLHTINELKKVGYKIIEAKKISNENFSIDNKSKLMITIPSSELSRGRGGPRCLTLPLNRGIINE